MFFTTSLKVKTRAERVQIISSNQENERKMLFDEMECQWRNLLWKVVLWGMQPQGRPCVSDAVHNVQCVNTSHIVSMDFVINLNLDFSTKDIFNSSQFNTHTLLLA